MDQSLLGAAAQRKMSLDYQQIPLAEEQQREKAAEEQAAGAGKGGGAAAAGAAAAASGKGAGGSTSGSEGTAGAATTENANTTTRARVEFVELDQANKPAVSYAVRPPASSASPPKAAAPPAYPRVEEQVAHLDRNFHTTMMVLQGRMEVGAG